MQDLQSSYNLLPNVTITPLLMNVGTSTLASGPVALSMVQSTNLVGVVGALYSGQSQVSATIFNIFKVPQISHGSASAALSDKSTYPYFMRTWPPSSQVGLAMLRLIGHFGWKHCIIIYGNDASSQSSMLVQ